MTTRYGIAKRAGDRVIAKLIESRGSALVHAGKVSRSTVHKACVATMIEILPADLAKPQTEPARRAFDHLVALLADAVLERLRVTP